MIQTTVRDEIWFRLFRRIFYAWERERENMDVKKNEDLKPCPFCGSSGEFLYRAKGYASYCRCSNGECGARSAARFTVKEAVEAWNSRV